MVEIPGSAQLAREHRCEIRNYLNSMKRLYPKLKIEIKEGSAALQNPRLLPLDELALIRRKEKEKFYELGRRSRICISPGGFGEYTTKDFEFVLMGCVILKPGSRTLSQYGNLYGSTSSLTSSYDLSDFENNILTSLMNLRNLERLARNAKYKMDKSLQEFPKKVSELFDIVMRN